MCTSLTKAAPGPPPPRLRRWAQERSQPRSPSRQVHGHSGFPNSYGDAGGAGSQSAPVTPSGGAHGGRLSTPLELAKYGYTLDDCPGPGRGQGQGKGQGAGQGHDGDDAVGVGAFRRPLEQLGLFGAPYLGGTPRGGAGGPGQG